MIPMMQFTIPEEDRQKSLKAAKNNSYSLPDKKAKCGNDQPADKLVARSQALAQGVYSLPSK